MGDYDFKQEDIINARERFSVPKRDLRPKVDVEISRLLGIQVFQQDPRLLNLIVKWKKKKGNDDAPDNFLKNPGFVAELRQVFGKPL